MKTVHFSKNDTTYFLVATNIGILFIESLSSRRILQPCAYVVCVKLGLRVEFRRNYILITKINYYCTWTEAARKGQDNNFPGKLIMMNQNKLKSWLSESVIISLKKVAIFATVIFTLFCQQTGLDGRFPGVVSYYCWTEQNCVCDPCKCTQAKSRSFLMRTAHLCLAS